MRGTMFSHCPVLLLALVSVTISEAFVLTPPDAASADGCHHARSYSISLHSLMSLCDGVSSSASGKILY